MGETKKKLLPAEVIKQLNRKSNLKGLIQLLLHLGFLLATAYAISIAEHGLWLCLTMLLHGIVLIFVFAPLHETIHYTAFKSRWLNNTVAAVFGFILFLPFQFFRAYHYVHHRHTQDPEKDPELIDKKPYRLAGLLWHISGIPTWRWQLRLMWQHARGKVKAPYIEDRHHARIVSEARVHLGLYLLLFVISLVNSNDWIIWYWLLPVLLGQPLLRLYLLAEHGNCDLSDNMLENSRTTYASPLINFLAWNMPYHAEHHYLASVPFHALPALHAYTGQAVKFRGESYWRVLKDIFDRVKQKQ